jgi:hypothetical protein
MAQHTKSNIPKTPSNKPARLKPGKYGEGDYLKSEHRQSFLRAIMREAPDVLNRLYETVFQPYGEALEGLRKAQIRQLVRYRPDKEDLNDLAPPQACFVRALWEWADTFGFGADGNDWIRHAAISTMKRWQDRHKRGKLVCLEWKPLVSINWGAVEPETAFLRFRSYTWNPNLEARDEARKRIKDEFQGQLDQFFKRLIKETKDSNHKQFERVENEEYFTWLVHFQVLGKSYAEIFQKFPLKRRAQISDEAVRKGIQRAAKVAGVELRELKQGRKPIAMTLSQTAN